MDATTTPQPTTTVWHTLAEAAAIARRTPKAMRQLRARQALGENVGPRFRKVDGRVLVSDDDLQAWLRSDADAIAKGEALAHEVLAQDRGPP